jgi:uncharacterized membrane protein (UPF0127 family)
MERRLPMLLPVKKSFGTIFKATKATRKQMIMTTTSTTSTALVVVAVDDDDDEQQQMQIMKPETSQACDSHSNVRWVEKAEVTCNRVAHTFFDSDRLLTVDCGSREASRVKAGRG